MFELNFRDERYLPFEGAGVISRWRIEMPKDTNAFEFNTLTDVVLHVKYTAREGGEILRKSAKDALQVSVSDTDQAPLARFFSLRHEFPTEWNRFLNPPDTADGHTLEINLNQERFPFQFRSTVPQISRMDVFWKFKDAPDPNSNSDPPKTYTEEYAGGEPLTINLSLIRSTGGSGTSATSAPLTSDKSFMDGIPHAPVEISGEVPVTLKIQATDSQITAIASALFDRITANGIEHKRLKAETIEDLYIVVHFAVNK